MEKTFTVVDTETQQTISFKTTATTIKELKEILHSKGINTNDKIIQEGLTKIEFKSDDAILPHDVPYKGTITNNLVFRLTLDRPKIKSGVDRAYIYKKIKEYHLEDNIKSIFGKNYTQCKTDDLAKSVNNYEKQLNNQKPQNSIPVNTSVKEETPIKEDTTNNVNIGNTTVTNNVNVDTNLFIINRLINILRNKNIITDDDIINITSDTAPIEKPKDTNYNYSKSEIDNLFKDF